MILEQTKLVFYAKQEDYLTQTNSHRITPNHAVPWVEWDGESDWSSNP